MQSPEVLVVGGGPAGSAAALWLARSGHDVLLVEKKQYPRHKTCGDGLTPRSIYELGRMGFDFAVPEFHRVRGLRSYAGDLKLELDWPDHPIYPSWGGVIRRLDLDHEVARLAEKEGAQVLQMVEAVPAVESGALTAVDLAHNGDRQRVQPRVVIIADGSLGRFGRQLGVGRDRAKPYGLALRGYFTSPNSHDDVLESQLDMRDEEGKNVPGYGWIFPLGDGTVNVGIGLLSTAQRWKGANTTRLMDTYVHTAPPYWKLSPEAAISEPEGGKLSMAFSGAPQVGANWIIVGDALGAINPFNGEGIAYAYETGRIAAESAHRALVSDDLARLGEYSQTLDEVYGDYYRVGRLFVRAIGNPAVMRTLVRTGIRSQPLMEWVLRVMSNLLRPEDAGMAERVYWALERIVAKAPDRVIDT